MTIDNPLFKLVEEGEVSPVVAIGIAEDHIDAFLKRSLGFRISGQRYALVDLAAALRQIVAERREAIDPRSRGCG